MLAFPAAIRICVAIQPVDMTKSFNGLWSAVSEQLQEDPKNVVGLARKELPQSELGKACAYLLKNWDVLIAHQKLSLTRIDNSLVENAIRPSAIGKKN